MSSKLVKVLALLFLITVFVLPASPQVVKKKKSVSKKISIKPGKVVIYNMKYEQVRCLGFLPERNQLKAVVDVKLSSGYKV